MWPVSPQVELQVWQYLAELHFKICQERRELAVPGISKVTQSGTTEALFTDEDVKAQRLELNIQRISMVAVKKRSTVGGFTSQPSGHDF